jgi:hypothetical protein
MLLSPNMLTITTEEVTDPAVFLLQEVLNVSYKFVDIPANLLNSTFAFLKKVIYFVFKYFFYLCHPKRFE